MSPFHVVTQYIGSNSNKSHINIFRYRLNWRPKGLNPTADTLKLLRELAAIGIVRMDYCNIQRSQLFQLLRGCPECRVVLRSIAH